MDDLISRQAAINGIAKLLAYHGSEGAWIDQKEALDVLKSLPSAQPEPHWIPVEVDLPKYGDQVLAFMKDGYFEINHVVDEEDGEWFENGVVAWMPMPKPYKAGEQE